MNNSRKIKDIYHKLFATQPNDTVDITKYLENKRTIPSAEYLAKRISIPVISAQNRLKQLQRLGLIKVHGHIDIDRIGMGRFANSLRKQNTQSRRMTLSDRGYLAVTNQINNPQIDDVYYNLTPHFQRITNRAFREFQTIRTPEIYIKALIYFSEHNSCQVNTLINVLGANNDVKEVINVMELVRLIHIQSNIIYVNNYRLQLTIKWLISEGQKTHGKLLASNLKAIIAQQLFNFD